MKLGKTKKKHLSVSSRPISAVGKPSTKVHATANVDFVEAGEVLLR